MGKTMLIIGLVWPEPSSSAAGWRMLQIIDLFLNQGYKITFASSASKSPYSYPLKEKTVNEQEIVLNDSSFDEFISELQPNIVLFDRFMIEEQYSWRVAQNCPNAIRILDTEDLHFVRNARQEAYKKNLTFSNSLLYSDLAKRELASIYRSDLSLIISQFEMNLLQDEFKINLDLIHYLPFQIKKGSNKPNKTFQEREHFMFIGNFLHEPNWKTVQVLKEIWPSMRKKVPNVEIHIYGAYPTEKVYQLDNPKQGFRIKGRVEDAIQTMEQYRVLLAPIPFGAGLKGKFIDALLAKTPSVTTAIGAEGMTDIFNWPGFIVDNNNDLLEKASLLYQDPETWEKSIQKSEYILQNMEDKTWGKDLIEKVEWLHTNFKQNRLKNIFGSILWTNQFLSTKYLSQWIEEKNKKAQT